MIERPDTVISDLSYKTTRVTTDLTSDWAVTDDTRYLDQIEFSDTETRVIEYTAAFEAPKSYSKMIERPDTVISDLSYKTTRVTTDLTSDWAVTDDTRYLDQIEFSDTEPRFIEYTAAFEAPKSYSKMIERPDTVISDLSYKTTRVTTDLTSDWAVTDDTRYLDQIEFSDT